MDVEQSASKKKPRIDVEMNRVAEIVLVLSALGRVRGGKKPTESETELMVEARGRLVEICQEFKPREIVGGDAVGCVIEDLGLSCGGGKDQRLGFRAPKLSISEKLSLGKRKMEELKKHPVVTTSSYASPGYTTPTSNVSMANHQWANSEGKVSGGSVNVSGGHFVRDVSGVTQVRPQVRPEMHTGASQGPAVPAGNYYGNVTPWSTQPHTTPSTITFGTPSESKVHVQSSSRISDPSFRPFTSPTPPGTFPGMKGANHGQTSLPIGNNPHAEIAKIVHKALQPRAKQNLLWNPPSREYMSKAISCQMCHGTVNEVETVLICDACEKGYHLKCLQANVKGVPKSEWHCLRCVQLYNGKPFPPKYGRVMRSATTAKMSNSTGEVQSPAEKKVGKADPKVGNQEPGSHSGTANATEDDTGMNQTVEAKDAERQTVEAKDAERQTAEAEDAGKSQTIEADGEVAINETVEAEDEVALNETVEAEDEVAMNETVEAEDEAAMNETVEAEDAAAMNETVEAEDEVAMNETVETEDEVAMNETVEAEDEDEVAMNETVEVEDEVAMNEMVEDEGAMNDMVEVQDEGAMNETVEAEDAAATNVEVDTNNEPQDTIGNDAECYDPSELENSEDPNKDVNERSISAYRQDEAEDAAATNVEVDTNNEPQDTIGNDAECYDPSELENSEDPNKDVNEKSISAYRQDENSKTIPEPPSQEQNSVTLAPPSQSNTDTDPSQQLNETPDLQDQEAIPKNDTENPEEGKSC